GFSLLVARTLTPLMAAYMLKRDADHVDKDPFWMRRYILALAWVLGNRWKAFGMGTGLFIGSLFLIPLLPFEFQPSGDRSRASFSAELPPGSTLLQTDAVVQRLSRDLRARPEVLSVYASIGGSEPRQSVDYGDPGGPAHPAS